MSELSIQQKKLSTFDSSKSLRFFAKSWIGIALIGQWAFAFYILTLYALPLITGDSQLISDVSPASGADLEANFNSIMFFSHMLPAIILALSGIFQIFPSIRAKYPSFHRWNGRIFLIFGVSGALTGLYLSWGAGLRLSDIGALGITLNGILIPIAIALAWYHIRNKRIEKHKRWALHSFMLVNGVWSFRLYLMAWYLINQGPNGNTNKVDGPMDIFLSFACYLLPMLFVELYYWAKKQKSEYKKWFVSFTMAAGCLFTLIGVGAAIMMMWLPRIKQVLPTLL